MGTSSFAAASYQDLLKLFEDDAMTVTLGFNNVLDEDRPACNPCGCIGMIRTSHDITGTVGYVRVTYQHE
jgi:hypothetical protein